MNRERSPLSAVLAGGGTAGHVEPALAVADSLRAADPEARIVLVGTATGLESRLVPARGHELAFVPRVPLPRRPTADLISLPIRLRRAIRDAEDILENAQATVVVGFGGYASLPVYLAARRRDVPVVVHEANARAGIANRIGARFAAVVAVANPDCGLRDAQLVGIPLRAAVATLDRAARRAEARAFYGLGDGPVLLVSGGSSGARQINRGIVAGAAALANAGVEVLHHAGLANVDEVAAEVAAYPTHHVVGYLDRMELAYAAADLMVCRAGAMTCAELSAVGLPAVYVPLPIGNGEQRLNALPIVEAGGGELVSDAAFDGAYVAQNVLSLIGDPSRLATMSAAARISGHSDAAEVMAELVRVASGKMGS